MVFYDEICVLHLWVSHYLVGETYGLAHIHDLYLHLGVFLTETMIIGMWA